MRRLGMRAVGSSEHGGVAVIVAILVVVLFGFAAIAIDVGALYWEQRQLQNGADAGSLAVAQDIAGGIADDGDQPPDGPLGDPYITTADRYADENAADGAADAETLEHEVLSSQAGVVILGTRVHGEGAGELSHWFAPVLGIDASVVRARAAAVYGPLTAVGGAFPVAICIDTYEDAGESVVDIPLKGTGGDPVKTDCETEGDFPPGHEPGNFSWLTPDGNACEFSFDVEEDATVDGDGDTGTNLPQACADDARTIESQIDDYASGTTDSLPVRHVAIFSSTEGTGDGAIYKIEKLAAFEFSGIKIVASEGPNPDTVLVDEDAGYPGWTDPICTAGGMSGQCVQGAFTGDTSQGVIDPDAEGDLLGVQLQE